MEQRLRLGLAGGRTVHALNRRQGHQNSPASEWSSLSSCPSSALSMAIANNIAAALVAQHPHRKLQPQHRQPHQQLARNTHACRAASGLMLPYETKSFEADKLTRQTQRSNSPTHKSSMTTHHQPEFVIKRRDHHPHPSKQRHVYKSSINANS